LPDINPSDAVDLNQAAARRDALKAAEEQQAAFAAMEHAARWDNAMQRAFKGIVTRKERHSSMIRSAGADS
jgi:sulfite reductase beta subunit-like hemoprotein